VVVSTCVRVDVAILGHGKVRKRSDEQPSTVTPN